MNTETIEQPTETPLKTVDEICGAIKEILKNNNVKIGTKQARTIEYSFLQGMMWSDPRYMRNAYMTICLISGRSILN